MWPFRKKSAPVSPANVLDALYPLSQGDSESHFYKAATSRAMRPMRGSQPPSRGERIFAALFPSGRYGFPGGWSQDRLEQVQHYRHWVYVAGSIITDQIKQLHPQVGFLKGEKKPTAVKRWHKNVSVAVQQHEEIDLADYDDPVRRLLACPNPIDTAPDLWSELELYKILCGVAYLWLIPNNMGLPGELWVVPSHWVWPRTGKKELIEYYEVRPWGGLGSAGVLRVPADQFVEFKDKSPLNKIDGYSPLFACAQWIDTEESISASRWAQFKNRARPEMWIELPDKEDSPDPDREDIERLQSMIAEKLQGEYATGKPIVMGRGQKIVPLNWSPEEMGYIQSSDQIRDMILSSLKVPKAAAGITEGMTYGSVLATLAGLFKFAINPRLSYNSAICTEKIAKRWDEKRRIWWPDGTPPDPQQVNADLSLDMQYGIRTHNEARLVRGLEPYKNGGDDPYLPMGSAPVPMNTGEDLNFLADLTPLLDKKESIRDTEDLDAAADEKPQSSLVPQEPNGKPGKKSLEEKGLFSSVQAAGQWLADKWSQLEERYGRKTALTMAIASIATFPIPFNITAIVAAAEGIRALRGDKNFKKPRRLKSRLRIPSRNGTH